MSKRGIPDCPRLSDRDGYGSADVDRYYGRDNVTTETSITKSTCSFKPDFEAYRKLREIDEEVRAKYGNNNENDDDYFDDIGTNVNININLNITVDPTNKKSIQKVYDFIDDVRNRYELCDDEDEEDDEED